MDTLKNKNKRPLKGGMMRSRHIGVILFAIMVLGMMFVPKAHAQEGSDQDSIWINIVNHQTGEENKNLTISFNWNTFVRSYNEKKKQYVGEWQNYDKADEIAYRVILAKDSTFSNIVKREDVANTREVTLRELEFDVQYFARVEAVNLPNPVKSGVSEGIISEKSASGKSEGEGNVFTWFWEFSVAGGILMPFIYLFALFGLAVCFPVTWWKLRLANVFPPNKPGLVYTILPFDRAGKTDFMTERGNAYIREITKYWGKAMEAQSIKPSLWKDEEEFIKADMQAQEEMKKKLWLKVGLPNIEKAIDICKNGVPGVKLAKKPLEYPFARVFLAVLENHRANKNAWWTSQEMDRAMSNTSAKEIDALAGWSINALWALGSVEPMLGLFGTVMGIRGAFMKITDLINDNPNVELTTIVPQLAEGIHVALITTITGLAFGVPFTLGHYFYKGKLDWIAGKWEEIIIDVLNRA